jgi:hypothetical protein
LNAISARDAGIFYLCSYVLSGDVDPLCPQELS